MIHNIAQVNLRGYSVHISRDDETDDIILFKYDDSVCDFQVFDREHQLDASDWILEPLHHSHYQVVFPGEESE